MTRKSAALTPAMRACLAEVRGTDEDARRGGVTLFVVAELVVVFVLIKDGWTSGALIGVVTAAALAALVVLFIWPRRGQSPQDNERYCHYAGLLDLCRQEEDDYEGGKFVRYTLRLASADERRNGQRGREIPIEQGLGEELMAILSVALPRVLVYHEATPLLFAIWDDRGRCLHHHPQYRVDEDAALAHAA